MISFTSLILETLVPAKIKQEALSLYQELLNYTKANKYRCNIYLNRKVLPVVVRDYEERRRGLLQLDPESDLLLKHIIETHIPPSPPFYPSFRSTPRFPPTGKEKEYIGASYYSFSDNKEYLEREADKFLDSLPYHRNLYKVKVLDACLDPRLEFKSTVALLTFDPSYPREEIEEIVSKYPKWEITRDLTRRRFK